MTAADTAGIRKVPREAVVPAVQANAKWEKTLAPSAGMLEDRKLFLTGVFR